MGDIRWPDGKKCAVMFTFDVDGDTTWENGNRGLKNGEKYIKSLSVGQYGPKRCVDRILQKLDQYGVKATFFVPGLTAERYPEVIKRIAEQDMSRTPWLCTRKVCRKDNRRTDRNYRKNAKNI